MCYGTRIARNNGVKPHGFAPRIDKRGSAYQKRDQDEIERKKINRLRDSNPKIALRVFRKAKKAATTARLQAAQRLIDKRSRARRKQSVTS